MKAGKIIVLAVTSIAAIGAALPAVADVIAPTGWYAEGNLGESRASNVNYTSGTPSSSTQGNGFGWNLNGGFKFMPYFAAEIGITSYADVKIKAAGTKVGTASHYSYDFAGKGIVPLNDSGFEVFAKLGVVRGHSHVTSQGSVSGVTVKTGTSNSTGIYYGLGGDYAFSPNWTAILQWQRTHGNSSIGNLDLYSIGIAYLWD